MQPPTVVWHPSLAHVLAEGAQRGIPCLRAALQAEHPQQRELAQQRSQRLVAADGKGMTSSLKLQATQAAAKRACLISQRLRFLHSMHPSAVT